MRGSSEDIVPSGATGTDGENGHHLRRDVSINEERGDPGREMPKGRDDFAGTWMWQRGITSGCDDCTSGMS